MGAPELGSRSRPQGDPDSALVVISADVPKCTINVGIGDWVPWLRPVVYRTVTSPWARVSTWSTGNAEIIVRRPRPRVKNEQPDKSKDCRAAAIDIKRRFLRACLTCLRLGRGIGSGYSMLISIVGVPASITISSRVSVLGRRYSLGIALKAEGDFPSEM